MPGYRVTMPPALHRRALLVAAAASATTAGCLSDFGLSGDPAHCDAVHVGDPSVSPRPVEEGDVTLYEDYVTVTVTVETDDPPTLHGRIEGCGRTESVSRELSPGTQTLEFGPYGHLCVGEQEFWAEGCRRIGPGQDDSSGKYSARARLTADGFSISSRSNFSGQRHPGRASTSASSVRANDPRSSPS